MTTTMMQFDPRLYQTEGGHKLYLRKRCILADEMGAGKTATVCLAVDEIWADFLSKHSHKPRVLIWCPNNAKPTWVKELGRCVKEEVKYINVSRKHSAFMRQQIWQNRDNTDIDVYITNQQLALRDAEFIPQNWDIFIWDEAHKGARNRKTKSLALAKTFKTPYLFPVTGSPASKGPQDTYGLLELIAPRIFPSYWRFVYTWCVVVDNGYGKEIVGTKNEANYERMISQYMIRRLKKDILPQLPPKERYPLTVDMTDFQSHVYSELEASMLVDIPNGNHFLLAQNTLTQLLRLRQILTTPKLLFETDDWGGGLEAIGEWINDSEDKHVAIFTAFTGAIPIIKQFLIEVCKIPEHAIVEFQGGMDEDDLVAAQKKVKVTRGVAICSIAYAQSYDLETIKFAFFLGYEWDPILNNQAEDRLHRMIITHQVVIYYACHIGTADERVLDVLDQKTFNTKTLYRSQNIRYLLRGQDDFTFEDLDEDDMDDRSAQGE